MGEGWGKELEAGITKEDSQVHTDECSIRGPRGWFWVGPVAPKLSVGGGIACINAARQRIDRSSLYPTRG